jgi:hypothetical protein
MVLVPLTPASEDCWENDVGKGFEDALQSNRQSSLQYIEAVVGISITSLWPGDRVRHFAKDCKKKKFPLSVCVHGWMDCLPKIA